MTSGPSGAPPEVASLQVEKSTPSTSGDLASMTPTGGAMCRCVMRWRGMISSICFTSNLRGQPANRWRQRTWFMTMTVAPMAIECSRIVDRPKTWKLHVQPDAMRCRRTMARSPASAHRSRSDCRARVRRRSRSAPSAACTSAQRFERTTHCMTILLLPPVPLELSMQATRRTFSSPRMGAILNGCEPRTVV